MRFGLQDRTFHVVPRPPAGWSTSLDDDMANLDGKLCYVHAATEASSFEVWLADDEGPDDELQWWLHCRIDFLPIPSPIYMRPVFSDGHEMLLRAVDKDLCSYLFWYNVSSKAVESVVGMRHELQYARPDGSKYMGQSRDLLHFMPYSESLVSLTACNY
ncbi:unnamed protein product [Urochloa humidicola]